MMILIDTTIWSLALRHNRPKSPSEMLIQHELQELIQESRATIVGPILQEVLSGIKHSTQFKNVKAAIQAFNTTTIEEVDYIHAAELYNVCRKKGVQGSHIDFLLCAVATRLNMLIFTLDKDFKHYAKHTSIKLHNVRKAIGH